MACGDGPSKGILHSQAWSYSSVAENRELARQHAAAQRKHVSFQRLAVVRAAPPVLDPPVLVESRCGAVALGSNISVSASFVWRCLSGSTVTPFPHPAHRTGHADLPHPALGQELTLSRATPSAVSDHLSELIGFPISKVLPYVLRLS